MGNFNQFSSLGRYASDGQGPRVKELGDPCYLPFCHAVVKFVRFTHFWASVHETGSDHHTEHVVRALAETRNKTRNLC
jgi:hypothetical protein